MIIIALESFSLFVRVFEFSVQTLLRCISSPIAALSYLQTRRQWKDGDG